MGGDCFSSKFVGVFYHIYMMFTCVFCTNSINILAGLNGLEVGQSLVIAISILIHAMTQLWNDFESEWALLSISLILPLILTSFGLIYYNWYHLHFHIIWN